MKKLLLYKEYSGENIVDIYCAINDVKIPIDEDNFDIGEFTVILKWSDENG